jgi:hypothetical protein
MPSPVKPTQQNAIKGNSLLLRLILSSLTKEIIAYIKPKIHIPAKRKESFHISSKNIGCRRNGEYADQRLPSDHCFTLINAKGKKKSVNIVEKNKPRTIPFKT